MTGTIINIAAILAGTLLGVLLGNRMPSAMRDTVLRTLGLVALVIGIQMAISTSSILLVMGSLVIGGVIGELIDIDGGLKWLGARLEKRFGAKQADSASQARFIRGFAVASLLFCSGPMTVVGAIQDALTGDFRLLGIKSMIDGTAAVAFAASFGPGVGFAALSVFVVQGSIRLLAGQIETVLTDLMLQEMTAAGGIMIVGIALSALLEIVPLRVANLLPSLVIIPFLITLLQSLGIMATA